MELRDYQVGDALPTLTKPPVTKTQLVMYSGASGDYNPIHTVEEFAHSVGLGGVIAHGMLTMAFAGQMLTDWIGSGGVLGQYKVRFTGMVRPGDTVSCSGEVLERIVENDRTRFTVTVRAVTDQGIEAISGTAIVWI
ncbi:MaoC family dehydratase N-terminal domain-containing protein [Tumebacillus sp. ITR2]|uniref:MaoC family dehydratase N-terminal domain-containing protein n=1 Tax=Tumebacillus amylolyticus TaxID=2801339 RepID=A0ABS1JET9_9BACL|nr:MaoC/PaaZ C-terminal domain-containing protein [Tumebacillus amylolyticus]MBL0388730.1 MaoC family dehydratase N-terminal domain-containing protein [Tumebacillus amylolyticus]